jgi:hypothetical protein
LLDFLIERFAQVEREWSGLPGLPGLPGPQGVAR